MTSSEACQGRSTSLGMPLSGERATDDHPDGVVPGVGDVDVPPGVDGDGQGVVEPGGSGGSFVACETNCSISRKCSNFSKIINIFNIIKPLLTKEKPAGVIIIFINSRE